MGRTPRRRLRAAGAAMLGLVASVAMVGAGAVVGAGGAAHAADTGTVTGTLVAGDGGSMYREMAIFRDGTNVTQQLLGGYSNFFTNFNYMTGAFTANVPVGDYVFEFLDGNGAHYPDYESGGVRTLAEATPVSVTTAGVAFGTVTLAAMPAITGTVIADDTGATLSSYTVTAYDATTGTAAGHTSAYGGSFTLRLAPGDYDLKFDDNNHTYRSEYYDDVTTLDAATPVTLTDTGASIGSVGLAPLPKLTGTITGPGGTALPYASVAASDPTTLQQVNQASVDSSGHFALPLPEGDYTIQFHSGSSSVVDMYYPHAWTAADAGVVHVGASGADLGGTTLIRKPTVRGTVSTAYGPVPTGEVIFYDHTNNYVTEAQVTGGDYGTQIAPGSYALKFIDSTSIGQPTMYDTDGDPSTTEYVTVGEQSPTVVPAETMPTGPVIQGTVTTPGGNPLSGTFYAFPADVTGTFSPTTYSSFTFDSATSTVLGAVPAGSYKLEFVPSDPDFSTVYYGGAADLADGTAVTVGDDGLDLGTVKIVAKPMVHATVMREGAPASSGYWHLYDATGTEIGYGTAFSGGRADIPVPAAGSYTFGFSSCSYGCPVVYYPDATALSGATYVDVPADGATLAQSVVLPALPAIRGTVVDASGSPITTAVVSAYSSDPAGGATAADQQPVGADGGFALHPGYGGYRLLVHDPSGAHLDAWYGGATYSAATQVQFDTQNDTTLTPTVLSSPAATGSIAGTVLGVDGKPLGGITAEAMSVGDYSTTTVATGTTEADGSYRLAVPTAGIYTVRFTDPRGEYLQTYLGNTEAWQAADTVTVDAALDPVTGAGITLPPAPAGTGAGVDVLGTITDDTGAPQAATVYAYDVSKPLSAGPVSHVATTRAGVYRFLDLDRATTATYKLRVVPDNCAVTADGFPAESTWLGGVKTFATSGTVIVAPDAAAVTADQRVVRDGRVTGVVTDAGAPATSGYVAIADAQGNAWGQASLDASGGYGAALPAGTWTLTAYADSRVPSSTTVRVATGTVTRAGLAVSGTLSARQVPTLHGTARVGSTLKADTGTWSVGDFADYAFSWLRNGRPIAGATSSSYVLTAADAGKAISVQVTATYDNGDHEFSGTATSSAVTPKFAPRIAVKATSPSRGRARVVVTIWATGLTSPGGTVTIKDGTRVVRSGVRVAANGKVAVSLTGLKKGRHTVTVSYSGSTRVLAVTAKAVATIK